MLSGVSNSLTGSVIGLALLAVLALVWWRIVRQIRNHLSAVRDAEIALALANQTLEQRVLERTAELSAAKETIVLQMRERERVERELRQAHKLDALGRLAAGVAHEINTPIQFVTDSVEFARQATGDLLGRLALHEDLAADPDLDFIAKELPVSLIQTLASRFHAR